MKCFSWLTGILLPFQFAMGQPATTLSIGDKLPTAVFNTIQNYPALKNTISPLKGKWLILDFMATSCLSCIEAIPRLDSLQKQYGTQLQILLITKQPRQKVNAFFQRNAYVKNTALPILTNDTVIANLFPHQFISHEVWIDPGGIIRAITFAQYVNKQNLDWALSSKAFRLPVKTDIERTFYDGKMPLLDQRFTSSSYSALLPYNDSLLKAEKFVYDTLNSTSRLSMVNFALIDLYRYSYGVIQHKPSQISLDIEDTAAFVYNSNSFYRGQWERKYTYGYESKIDAGCSRQTMLQKMRADVDAWFGLRSSLEKRVVSCYVLKETGETKPAVASTSSTESAQTISQIVYNLNGRYFHPPVLDERKNKKNFPATISTAALNNIDELNKQLAYYGLALFTETREMLILTITKNKSQATKE